MRTSISAQKDWIAGRGGWWRFGRYEMSGGYIRPARDARLDGYDPWSLYRGTRQRGYEWVPPYGDFVNLRSELSKADWEKRVLDWCSRYGLPGVLLHQTLAVTLAPRWTSVPGMEPYLVPEQDEFVRTSTGWSIKHNRFMTITTESKRKSQKLEGTLVARDVAPDAWARVGVVRQELRSGDLAREPLRDTWWKYFPEVPEDEAETFRYPAPLSEAFWRSYAEPYAAFLDSMQLMANALWDLEHHQPIALSSRVDRSHVADGRRLLHALLAPASPTIVAARDGSFSQQWVCGSLLSAFAMMALQDLTEGQRVRRCSACERLFVSQHPAALYCSGQCRWKIQKRRQRENQIGDTAPKPVKRRTRKP